MTDITFLTTTWKYDPYIDFFRLVKLAGFPIMNIKDLVLSDPGVYIISPHNGQWDQHMESQEDGFRNAHLIHWNLERPSGSAGSVGKYGQRQRELQYKRLFDEVWVSDRRLADETSLRYVTLGSHPELGEPGQEKIWDFTHQSYANPRRQTVYKDLDPERIGRNCWPPKRDKILRESKFGLATHQDGHPFIEPLRLALFAAYGLPILSETVFDPYPFSTDTMAFHGYDGLAAAMKQALSDDYGPWQAMGMRAREMMTVEYEFGKVVREAVDQSVGEWR